MTKPDAHDLIARQPCERHAERDRESLREGRGDENRRRVLIRDVLVDGHDGNVGGLAHDTDDLHPEPRPLRARLAPEISIARRERLLHGVRIQRDTGPDLQVRAPRLDFIDHRLR